MFKKCAVKIKWKKHGGKMPMPMQSLYTIIFSKTKTNLTSLSVKRKKNNSLPLLLFHFSRFNLIEVAKQLYDFSFFNLMAKVLQHDSL